MLTGLHTPVDLLWYDGWLYVRVGHDCRRVPDGVGLLGGLAINRAGRLSLGISAPCDACTPESEYSAAIVSFRE